MVSKREDLSHRSKKTFNPFIDSLPEISVYKKLLSKVAPVASRGGDLNVRDYGNKELGERLKRARLGSLFPSATDAARAYGWPVATYVAAEQGRRAIAKERLLQYALAFAVPLKWLAEGDPREMIDLPAGAGAIRRFDIIARAPIKQIRALITSASADTEPWGTARRLRVARIMAGFETATEAASFFSFNRATYGSHENGTNGVPGRMLALYALAFGVDRGWLSSGHGGSGLPTTPAWPESSYEAHGYLPKQTPLPDPARRADPDEIARRKSLIDAETATARFRDANLAIPEIACSSDGKFETIAAWFLPTSALSADYANETLAIVRPGDATDDGPLLIRRSDTPSEQPNRTVVMDGATRALRVTGGSPLPGDMVIGVIVCRMLAAWKS